MCDIASHVAANRQYKDSLFCVLFGQNKENALSLYNAVNHTNYDDPAELEFATLQNVIYLKMKNDVSFVIDKSLNLYEHQSSYNPNMPLRGFLYFASLYQTQIHTKRLHSRRLVKIPNPNYLVFYNGKETMEESRILKLSDAFETKDDSGRFEWSATMININYGCNKTLMENCIALQHYSIFISKVRAYNETMDLREAIDMTVQECIRDGILSEFLTDYRKELPGMILTEFDEEEIYKMWQEEAYEDGHAEGHAKGLEEGRAEGRAKGLEEGLAEGHSKGLEEGRAEGRAKGLEEGLAEGRAKGLEEGREEGREEERGLSFFRAIKLGLDPDTAATVAGYTMEQAQKALADYQEKSEEAL